MRHAFEAAQRRSDDRAERLEAHIRRRLKEKFPLPERAAATKLRSLHPGEIAAIVLENLPYAISTDADWWRTSEILNRALGLADELDTETRLRIGNLALNLATDGLPDLFEIDYQADHAPRVTPGAEGRLLAARSEDVDSAHEPTTELPPSWDGPKIDGHFFVRSVHPEVREAVRDTFADGSIRPHARAVSALQSVRLMINPRILDCLRHYDEYDSGIEHVPPKKPPTHRNAWWQRQLQGRHRSLRVRLDRNLETATRLLGKPFHVRFCCDSRGRLVSITDIHFGREDTIRGLLMFARSKPIGEDGIRRLKIQVATCCGCDGVHRADEDTRARWCDDNMGMVRMIARLPKWRLSQRWLRGAREPIQFLAACIELLEALEKGPTFETRLPCTIDATASGYQILALMRGATEEAALVNLLPDMPPQDFYGQVADELETRLRREYSTTERKPLALTESEVDILLPHDENDSSDEAAERGLFADWALRDLKIDRDLVKTNTMTKPYDADERGAMADQNFKQFRAVMAPELAATELEPCHSRDELETRLRHDRFFRRYISTKYRRRSTLLAQRISEVVGKLMPRAYETMEWLHDLAVALGKRGKFVRWQTPSGFPFVNCYRNPATKRLRFLIGAEPRQKTVITGWNGARLAGGQNVKSAVVANTVHACDAALLMLTVNAAARAGIVDVVTVHDCYGCHAPDVERLREIILGQLKLVFEHRDTLREIWNETDVVEPPPSREAFGWNGLMRAQHAFS
jgi:DNA-directed RNA polymerase